MLAWWSKTRAAVGGRRELSSDLDEEVRAHLQLEVEDRIAAGMSREEALTAARKHFGNLTSTKEKAREAWSFTAFETFLQDIHYALRGIRRSKAFSLVVILTFALGIGPTTAIFSVVYTALLSPLPYPSGERLVRLEESTPSAEGISVTWLNFLEWREQNHSFEDMAAYEQMRLTMTGRGYAESTAAGVVSSSFLPLLGNRALLGRMFSEQDERPGAPPAVVLSHAFWASRLGGEAGVLGSALDLDGRAYQIVGVLAPGPDFFPKPVDYYVPLEAFEGGTVNRAKHGSIRVLARLKPGATLQAARADLNSIMQRLAQSDPGPENDHKAYGEFLAESNTHEIRPVLLMLMAAVGLVLLIACANVASLMLARGAARGREIAIRSAIGSGRMRLVRQLLTESLVYAMIGGAAGVMLAYWCLRALVSLAPGQVPRLAETGLNLQVLLFAAAITILTGLATGSAPVFAIAKVDLANTLKTDSGRRGGTQAGQSLRSLLVIGEIAVTLVLCFGAGLLLRSLIAAQTSYPGFTADHLLELELVLPKSTYPTNHAIRSFLDKLSRELRALPGVTEIAMVKSPPSAGDNGDWFYSALGKPQPARNDVPISLFNAVTPGYFRIMRIPVRQGREFRDSDSAAGPLVAVINENLARKWWPGASAVGKQIKVGGPYLKGPVLEIVGVAGDVSQMGLDEEPLPEIYQPFSQSASDAVSVMIRSSTDTGLAAAVRQRVAALDRDLPIQRLRPFEQRLATTLERRRFVTLLLALFAALAIFLAGVGIYGLLTYWVRVREIDIGIRMALGADPAAIVRWVTAQALRLAMAGVVTGTAAAWLASRWMESQVFGISPHNPATLAGAVLAILGLALLATAVPAWRATRVDALHKLKGA